MQAETASPGKHQFVIEGVFRKLHFYSDFKASEWFLLNVIREVYIIKIISCSFTSFLLEIEIQFCRISCILFTFSFQKVIIIIALLATMKL